MKLVLTCTAVTALILSNQVARAEPPVCSDPEVLQGVSDRARDSVASGSTPIGNVFVDKILTILVPDGKFDVKVTEMFTVSHSESTRECQATLHLVEPGRVDGTTPIYYSVVRTDDGKTMYALKGEQALASPLFDSLKVNNDLTEATDAVKRDMFRSATIKPLFPPMDNRPAPSYPHSNLKGTGNRRIDQ